MTSSEDAAFGASPATLDDWHELLNLWRQIGADERRVVLFIAERLLRGQRDHYGKLRLADDPRNWEIEAAEEYADASVYLACAVLARSRPGER